MTGILPPYLLFLGDVTNVGLAKTAFGIRDWQPGSSIGQWTLPGCTVDIDLPFMDPAAARAAGARSLVIGVAPFGGAIPSHWIPALVQALETGLNLVSGMHQRLADIDEVAALAKRLGRTLHDVRHTNYKFEVATGRKRTGRRLLTVGTDCAVGKKYTALAIARELQGRGIPTDFRATGQTGIMIAGRGVAVDAVVSDFVAGAAEWLSPDASTDHWDVIEGQGSLFHPAYSAVTLGLLHGSQPDALVLCHDPSRPHINGYPGFPLPRPAEALELYLRLGKLTNPEVQFVGVSLNTSRLEAEAARDALAAAEHELGLPVVDPIRQGAATIVDALLRDRP